MPGVYGGDDISAIVLDPGSSVLRAGWAGEDTPRVVNPSQYGWIQEDGAETYGEAAAKLSSDVNGDTAMADASEDNVTTDQDAPNAASQDSRTKLATYLAKKEPAAKIKKRYFGDSAVGSYRSGKEISPTVVNGVVSSVPDACHLFNNSYQELGANPSEHPLLLTESTWTPRQVREELTEMAFEALDVPAFYLANQTVLSSFSAGKPSSVIVDVGHSSVSVIPVVDGFVIRKGIVHQPLMGGSTVSRALAHGFRNPPPKTPRVGGPIEEFVPTYRVKSKKAVEIGKEAQWEERSDRVQGATDSYKKYQEEKLLHEAKESLCQILDTPWDENIALSRPARPFEFPNGYNDMFGIERYRASEILFSPNLWTGVDGVFPTTTTSDSTTNPSSNPPTSSTSPSSALSISQMVIDSISSVDVDARPILLSNIVCVGGGTFIPGFLDRLSYELTIKAPSQKIKIHSPGNSIERRHSSWLGGSILASLGTFHQMWISKQEYAEHGAGIIHARAR
ncbi:unnamed protein product [Sympodiomycopsis kandeliae]